MRRAGTADGSRMSEAEKSFLTGQLATSDDDRRYRQRFISHPQSAFKQPSGPVMTLAGNAIFHWWLTQCLCQAKIHL